MQTWTMGKVQPPYRQSLLHNLRQAPERLAAAAEGLTDADLDADLVPGKWTCRQLFAHVVKVDLGWTDILYESVSACHPELPPHVPGWREPLEARLPRSLAEAQAVFAQNHREVVAYLDLLPEEAYTYEHPAVQWLVQAKIPFVIKESVNWGLSVHVDHHLIQIHARRVLLGKPLEWMATLRTA